MNYSQLKNAIVEVIRTNGNEEITGEVLQYTLLEMVSMLGKDYQFAGVGTPLTDTTERDDNVAWILGRGTYENFGNPFTVAVDEIAVVKYDGTFTVEKIKTGVVVDSELTLEGKNPVEGGAIALEFAKMRAAGYFFAGIMTPTGTPPHEITEKIFYLCTQAGVYPNFDSIVLDRGLNILKWNGSRWSADLVFAITDDVTEGLASLLTSAGAYAAIAAEAQLRQEGDAAVQQNIDAVEALIPSQASVENKLVDEQKMNSSIATATATYRGAYNQVSNLNLGVDATHEQVALALASQMAYLHITPDNNDYCYVQVPTSSETPTEIAHVDRYKYNGTAWGYEYTLNNSGYTAAQWAAINSGITSGLVAKLGALPTAEELAAALLAKQDVLTFDNAPTPSSTNPVTSGGVYTAIDDEKGARINADAALQQAIEAILLLIPSAATALNQLADKAFVNSSIATATATFRGTFNLLSDLQLTVDATHADIAAALLNAISGADNNDYAFVQIPTSVDTPTEIRVTERYKFNGTAWAYEYDLNNSGFTAQQWAAINSGITALLVTKLSNLPNATELATLFAGKQNVLTFDNAPVSGSDNPVKSGGLYDLFAAIDAKMPTGASANNKLVAEDRLAAYVGGIIGALDSTFDLTSTDGHVTLRMTQTDGVIASLQILTYDIASASALATLGGQVSTNADDIAALQDAYAALTQSDVVVGALPSSGQQQNIIYRQPDQDHTPPQFYSDYMWNGSTWVLMATYNNAIDPRPKKASQNLVTSGGVFDNMGALDVSELNATENPHTLATYANLSAAIAAIPSDYQKGGMSIKFVQSSDNKYVQYRLMSDTFNTTEANWQGIDDEPIIGSDNLVKSGGVFNFINNKLGYIAELVDIRNSAYLNSEGEIKTTIPDYSILTYTLFEGVNSFYLKCHCDGGAYTFFYDANGNVTGSIQGQGDMDGEYTIPLGSVKICISLVPEYDYVVRFKGQSIEDNLDVLNKCVGNGIVKIQNIDGYYINGFGENVALDAYSIAVFQISGNLSSIHIKCESGPGAYNVFYDKNDNILDIFANTSSVDIDYNIPEYCTYFKISYLNEDDLSVIASQSSGIIKELEDIRSIKKNSNILDFIKNKKIGIIGDSLAVAGNGFIYTFGELAECNSIKNAAQGGMGYMSEGEGYGFWNEVNGSNVCPNYLDGDEKFIFIYGGINDFGNSNPIGNPWDIVESGGKEERVSTSSQYTQNVCGGMHKLIETLYAKYNGYIPIIIGTPVQRNGFGLSSRQENEIGKFLDEYVDAIKKVASFYSIPVWDAYNLTGLDPNNGVIYASYFADGLHPNAKGYEVMGKSLYNFCSKISLPL